MRVSAMLPVALVVGLAAALAAAQGSQPLEERIEFQVTTVQESAGARNTLSEALISGPPETDFDILLQGSRLRMTARFLTDLQQDGNLLVRARLDTRRLYGTSERGLPLYEEDSQQHALEVSFEEQIVLLPFGRGGEERLLIEITPWRTQRPAGPLSIDLLKTSPGGQVSIRAHKVPHDYRLNAALLLDGKAITATSQQILIEKEESILLPPTTPNAAPTLNLKLTIDRYESAGSGRLTFHFDALHRGTPAALNWAGITELGSTIHYPISVDGQDCLLELRFELLEDD